MSIAVSIHNPTSIFISSMHKVIYVLCAIFTKAPRRHTEIPGNLALAFWLAPFR